MSQQEVQAENEYRWREWLKGLNLDATSLAALASVLNKDLQPSKEILITREKTEDLYVPDPAPIYVDIHGLFPIYDALAFGSNLLVKGPKGDGKTLSFVAFAHKLKVPLVTVECSENVKDTSLLGSFSLRGRDTIFTLGKVPTAIDVANEVGACMLVFEEVNALTPQVQKSLNALLDFRRFITIPVIGKTYRLRPGAKLWVVMTSNPSVYGGTYDLNEDFKSRLEEVEVGYPVQGHEKHMIKTVTHTQLNDRIIDMVLGFAKETRQQATSYAFSPRDTVRLIETIEKFGGASQDPAIQRQALQAAVQLAVCKFEGEDRAVVVQRAVSQFPGIQLKQTWGAA